MTVKFGREYRLVIDPADGGEPILITLPFTINFDVQRNTLSSLNVMSLEIYNLSAANRARIFQDRFDLSKERKISLEVGYTTLYRIFSGRIYEASSAREGVNIVTRIEARSGIFDVAASQTYQTVQAGQTVGDVLKTLIGQFSGLQLGAVGSFTDKLLRPAVLNGNTYNLLRIYSGNNVFIDNDRVYVLRDAETLAGQIIVLNDATGLLETPRRDDGFLVVTTLLEASVQIAAQVKLESSIQTIYNGQYKVVGLAHQGMISAAKSGVCRSMFQLLAPNKFKQFTQVSQP